MSAGVAKEQTNKRFITPSYLSSAFKSTALVPLINKPLTVITRRDVTEALLKTPLLIAVAAGLGIVGVIVKGHLVKLEPLHVDSVHSIRVRVLHL